MPFRAAAGFLRSLADKLEGSSSRSTFTAKPPPYESVEKETAESKHHNSTGSQDSTHPSQRLQTLGEVHRRQSPDTSIQATDVPQWRWTNSQCKEWLVEVLVVYCGKSRVAAEELAKHFQGFGPTLYRIKPSYWGKWLGADGRAICALLFEMQPNAVPKGIIFDHDA